jgi:hypothetical protein
VSTTAHSAHVTAATEMATAHAAEMTATTHASEVAATAAEMSASHMSKRSNGCVSK